MGLRVEKLRLVLEMQAKDLTKGVSKSIIDLKKLDVATAKAAAGVSKSFDDVERGAQKSSAAQRKAAAIAAAAAKKTEEAAVKAAVATERASKKTAAAVAKAAAAAEKASKRAAAAAERGAKRTAAAAKRAAAETARFNKSVVATQAALAASAAKITTTVPAAFVTLERRVGQAATKLRTSLNGARIAIAAFGAGALIAAPVKFAASFEKALANVDTLLVDSAVGIERYEAQLLKLSVTTSKELIDLTQGLYQTISAGIPAVEGAGGAFGVLEKATKAAEAGLATTEQAVDAFTTILNAYSESGLTAAEISDKLFTTIRIGKTTFPELASSIGRVATVASKFNIDIDEMLAALAELTKNGLSSDEAVTQLRATILGLARPADKVRESLSEMGVEIGAAAFESKGLIGVLKDIGEVTGDDADEIAKLLPNIRALVGGLVLGSNGAKGFQASLEALQDSTGATDAAFAKISQTFEQTFAIFKSQVQSTLVVVGNKLLPELKVAFKSFGEAIVENQELIAESFKSFFNALLALGKFVVKFGPGIAKFFATAFAVSRIIKATAAIVGFVKVVKGLAATAGAAAGANFAVGFAAGAPALKSVVGGLLKSKNILAIAAAAGLAIGSVLIDAISEAYTAGEVELQAQIEASLKASIKRADETAKALGFVDFEDRSAQAESRKQGALIRVGPNRGEGGGAASADELVTPSQAFQQILVDVEGNIGAARDFLAEEIAEETGQLAKLRDRALAVAKREFDEVERLRKLFGSIKNANGSFAKRIEGELETATKLVFAQEALAKDIDRRIKLLEVAPDALAQTEQGRRDAKAAEEKTRTAAAKRAKNAAAFIAKLRASEQARRALLKGASDLRLKDAAAAAAFEQSLAEESLKAQESAAAESFNIAKARGDSDDDLLALQEKNAKERIELINAVELAQTDALTASTDLQKQTDDSRIKSIEELGRKALLSARGVGAKIAEIEEAVQAKIQAVLNASEIKREQLGQRRVAQAKATGEAILTVESNIAAARRGTQEGPGAQGLTTGGVADAADKLLGNVDTFLAGELNKAQRDAASEAAGAAADAVDKSAAASARFRATGASSDKASALSAVGGAKAAQNAATEAGAAALGGAGLLAGASGIIGIALAVDKAVDLIGTIGSFLETGLTDFGSKIGANFEQLAIGLEAFPDQLIQFFGEQLPEFIDRFFERLPEVLQALIPGIAGAIPVITLGIIGAVPAIVLGLAKVFLDPDFWGSILSGVLTQFFKKLIEAISGLGEQIVSALSGDAGGGLLTGAAIGGGLGFLAGGPIGAGIGAVIGGGIGDSADEAGLGTGALIGAGIGGGAGFYFGGPLGAAGGAAFGGVVGAGAEGFVKAFLHQGGSVASANSSPNAAAFMSAAGAPGFQGGGLVESVGASLRNAFGAAFKDDVPATLQTGEFVLSRQAVAALGGPRGAEAVNRGGSPGGPMSVNITPSSGGMDALLRTLIASVTIEAATPGTGLRNAVVGADPFLGSQFVRGRKA